MKLAILDDYQGVALDMADWTEIRARCDITVYRDHLEDPEAVVARLRDYDIVAVMRERTPLTRAMLERLPRLRMIASNSAANVSIDTAAAADLGIRVSHTEWLVYGTTEITWGLILTAMANLRQEMTRLRSGGWQGHVQRDIHGRTLGILGLGNFGVAVARVGLAFGMRVIAWSRNLDPDHARAHGVEPVSREALFACSDILSVHMKLSARSRGMVGAEELAMMKREAWIINASRGPLIDEAALIAALEEGRIGGAGLDVFDREPLPVDHPFRRLENVVATPHIGFVTEDTYRLFYGQMVAHIAAFLSQGAAPRPSA
ncbi:D-2-hydroxyacid dehydrogenase family protein [Pseudooceanicola sp. GBMRC 2024]|uniref:D-2-hydroxyacid dehydrogenase family protein n=1 Tax=Pseudooceanicola albus TaxID=2692189 RepID=A0A6L7G1D8_9RHOB|nr:D-2-hydroxyacid dehydrogenase family protein [Pseudooceanicola albus]